MNSRPCGGRRCSPDPPRIFSFLLLTLWLLLVWPTRNPKLSAVECRTSTSSLSSAPAASEQAAPALAASNGLSHHQKEDARPSSGVIEAVHDIEHNVNNEHKNGGHSTAAGQILASQVLASGPANGQGIVENNDESHAEGDQHVAPTTTNAETTKKTIEDPRDVNPKTPTKPDDIPQISNSSSPEEAKRETERTTEPAELESSTSEQVTTEKLPEPPPASTTLEPECETVCLNEGKCVRLSTGQEICICPPEFYGSRCQLRNICKTVIADSLTGDEICARLGSDCKKDDKLFRCLCRDDEYFVFKADYYRLEPSATRQPAPVGATLDVGPNGGSRTPAAIKEATAKARATHAHANNFAYDNPLLSLADGPDTAAQPQAPHTLGTRKTYFLAECRKIDKCLGVRCRQMSEKCVEGECACNQNLGYIRDPKDGLCKLLDPCKMPTVDGKPLCGQAKCVATYDRELYHCVCPIGYTIVQKGTSRASTQCGLPFNTLCDIPLLNKCQHLCRIDQKANTYKCSCLPGYVQGSRVDVDDHLCFFDDYPMGGTAGGAKSSTESPWGQRHAKHAHGRRSSDEKIPYDSQTATGNHGQRPSSPGQAAQFRFRPVERLSSSAQTNNGTRSSGGRPKKTIVIKRELIMRVPRVPSGEIPAGVGVDGISRYARKSGDDGEGEYSGAGNGAGAGSGGGGEFEDDTEPYGADLSALSAQDRCNMYCEENKICVLEEGSVDSYRCVCDRQGYVSVGDKCLDWCSAADFSHGVQSLVDEACYTGLCRRRPEVVRPPPDLNSLYYRNRKFQELPDEEKDLIRLESRSSWRPSFECDCSKSPVMFKDPQTHLCQLDFEAILRPCQPGEEGHTDCVVNKHAYCAVLHRPAQSLYNDFKSDMSDAAQSVVAQTTTTTTATASGQKQMPQSSSSSSSATAATAAAIAAAKKLKVREKPYTCVCSPEKKFLVDKPRNKARCIDECDLLNSECGRFNRMCRRPSVESNEDFGFRANLIRLDRDGVRMNQFRRTGCECLPGFNVGPTEARDFTLDDNDARGRNYNNYPGDALSLSGGAPPPSRPPTMFTGGQPGVGGAVPSAESSAAGSWYEPQLGLISGGQLVEGDFGVPNFDHPRAKYMNINSRCLLDYDVVEFHARFKAPADFEPAWVRVRNSAGPGQTPYDSGPEAATGDPKPPGEGEAKNQPSPGKIAKSNSTIIADKFSARDEQPEKKGNPQHQSYEDSLLRMPEFMRVDISDFYKHIVLVGKCDRYSMAQLSLRAFEACIRYRYWVVHKLRTNFADWRQVMSNSLRNTFDLMDGNIRFRVNKCETTINRVTTTIGVQPSTGSGELGQSTGAPPSEGQQKQLHRSASSKAKLAGEQKFAQSAKDEPTGGKPDGPREEIVATHFDPLDQYARVDADVDCELTIHSASDDDSSVRRHVRKVLLEKQLPRFIFNEPKSVVATTGRQGVASVAMAATLADLISSSDGNNGSSSNGGGGVVVVNSMKSNQQNALTALTNNSHYYLMAPSVLIARDSYDRLAVHRKLFSPCKSDYAYCDKQTRCEMVDSVNYTCTCEAGYTPIGSRDIYLGDSRKEVCEDINECLFDVCKLNGLENKSVCVNEIGDYKCQCIRHHVGDNKRYCNHICNVIACKHGDCRIPDEHHAFCECHEGYREPDCSVQDPSVALRKANMIICGSIFASVLLLAITLAISLNSQLKKTKKKLKRLEAAQEAVEFYEFSLQQPPYRQRVSKASTGS